MIVVLNIIGNLFWIQQNIVLVGRDASNYLKNTLSYREILTDLSPLSLFHAFTYPQYRTPGLYIAAQPFLHLFGFTMDGAQYLNVALSAVVIVLTYCLGAAIADRRVGLFAALLVSLLPMMAAMARLFYTEMFLTAAVAANLLALHKSDGFARRSWSLAWGVSLGVGLLVKWTMPIYLWLPVLWVLWRKRSDFLRDRWPAWQGRRLLLALLAAFVIATLWYWPNRFQAETFLLGKHLWPAWILILTPATFGLALPSSRWTNLVAAVFVGLSIASLWYLPHADIGFRLFVEDQARSEQDASLLNPDNYLRYFRHLYFSHFGPLAFWLIAPPALCPWLRAWSRRQSLNASAILLWLNIASALIVLSLILQQNSRNLVPVLPSVAILCAIGLWQYRLWLRRVLGGVWVVVLGTQLFLYTVDAPFDFYHRTQHLWASRQYLKQPAIQETDPGYWVGPQILETISRSADVPHRLTLLVNSHQIHRGIFKYLIEEKQLDVTIEDVTEIESRGWHDVISAPWVLIKDGDNRNVAEKGQALIDRIFAGDSLFGALYQQVDTYSLPDGERLYLYKRSLGPGSPIADPSRLMHAAQLSNWIKERWRPGIPLIYSTPDVAVWVGMHDPVKAPVIVLNPANGDLSSQFPVQEGAAFVVFDQNALALEQWLDRSIFRAADYGTDDAWVVIYGFTSELEEILSMSPRWNEVQLHSLRTLQEVRSGEVLPVEIQVSRYSSDNLKLSLRLVGPDGTIVSSQDRFVTEVIRFGLFAPPESQPGEYRIVAILYDGTTMVNIPAISDFIENSVEVSLATVQIVRP
ncbi:MAG: glycosyltransferase family 39 protein [Caldilinea sp.]|uniref:glycosyltransferase family 39 protein n=1 Tax=Caldilinea sp. TaxID=2293560 RepID=UPI0030B05CBF